AHAPSLEGARGPGRVADAADGGAQQLGRLVAVGLEQEGPRVDGAPQRLAARVDGAAAARGPLLGGEGGVVGGGQARRQAAGEDRELRGGGERAERAEQPLARP